VPLAAPIDQLFDRDIRALPDGARVLLTTAAMEPSAGIDLIRRSAIAVGVDLAEDPEAHLGRLASVGAGVTFSHPLVRSAVYRIATPNERRRIHAALANVVPDGDVVRRAWHLAGGVDGADDAVADELDMAADTARTRGGFSAESELLQRSAELTTNAARRDERILRSAAAAVVAGQMARALSLMPAEPDLRDPVDPQARLVRAKALFGIADFAKPPSEFAAAARSLKGVDDAAARDAWHHALFTGFAGDPSQFGRIAGEIPAAALAPGPDRTFIDLVAVGLVRMCTGDRRGGIAVVREAFANLRIDIPHAALGIEAVFAALAAVEAFHASAGRQAVEELLERDQRRGALPGVEVAHIQLASIAALEGRIVEGNQHLAEAIELHRAWAANSSSHPGILYPLALTGRDAELDEAYQRTVTQGLAWGFGSIIVGARVARGEMLVSRGRYADAVAELRDVFAADALSIGTRLLPTLVEAAARSGEEPLAHQALERLATRTAAAGTAWGDGLHARCQAILAPDTDAEALYHHALERLTEARMPLDHARTQLLYGEWLRRQKRRTDAIEQLGNAHEALSVMGAAAFADRARNELHAAGGRARRRTPETRDNLTAQERQVAISAATGATNREIASTMFISEATVAYHLRKVFQKRAITSRRQLRELNLT
jgi:DNA-binding CsgD family transcriptional regulator